MKLSQSKQMSYISIHAPRAGSDMENVPNHTAAVNFNPRSPCGERRGLPGKLDTQRYFNPRSPCGERLPRRLNVGLTVWISIHAPRAGSDKNEKRMTQEDRISIHAPRAGSDYGHSSCIPKNKYFNPRSPCGERQQYIVLLQVQSAIYTQSAILSIVNAIKGRRLLIEFGAKACGISCVLQIRTHKTSGSSTEIVSFEP